MAAKIMFFVEYAKLLAKSYKKTLYMHDKALSPPIQDDYTTLINPYRNQLTKNNNFLHSKFACSN